MTLLQCKSSQATKKSNSLWNRSNQVNLRQLLIEYHIYIFVKIQNAIFKTNLYFTSILSKQPKVGLDGDQLLHLWCFDSILNDIDLHSLFYSQCSFGPKEARRPSAKQAGKPLFKFSLTFSCSKFRETQGMRPTQQTDQNFIAWNNALYCIVHCKMYGMDMLSMSLLPSTVFFITFGIEN